MIDHEFTLLPDPSGNQSEEDRAFLRHDSALDDNNAMVGDSHRFLIYISKRGLDNLIKYGHGTMGYGCHVQKYLFIAFLHFSGWLTFSPLTFTGVHH